MTEETKTLSHGRLLTRFAQLGPYLRQKKSTGESYFFDCLSACVNAKKTPESREFWGWWMKLTPKEGGFEYSYTFGKFNTEGEWLEEKLPKKCVQEVTESLDTFYKKIAGFVEGELALEITALPSLKKPKLGTAA
ncbi:sigma factor-binding protein Crl [Enterovibrio norvegicus FF-33]|uniref:Sigma factor-binding protein Crl n=1 Tax=Enterovibrio norvegicus FF-454 TaxID=1185651 RepID=A0A1E5C598_9GAMM|nr:sigma factor-binding protein Crl [Enterovibrio norvegicus]OEE60666.1 sigma factor-binding protein Crl [Enterovibrio norvegicus FF-454]OEE69920.1 sigma factor-binding protein Crl [Enterovibrio norvegicus FF-33]OEE90574.1 sigma factor-binding protein Crl [Enterovibrio norvegicus FF-162]